MSSSDPIPNVDTIDPPHRQAAATYRKAIKDNMGRKFQVTMEYPSEDKPKILEIEIGRLGAKIKSLSAIGAASLTSSTPASRRLSMPLFAANGS